MVTGVETAGLVLAVLPIVIEGLKAYLDGIESIKRWWKYTSVLKHLIRILRMEHAKFLNTCTELLHDLVAEPELLLLLEEPGNWRWRGLELSTKLRQRLGCGFHAYLEAVTDMTDILDEFRRKLELGPKDKPQWVDYKSSKREWKRVKLSLCEDANERLLKRMEKNNADLETLLGQSLRLEAAKPPPKSANNAKRYDRVRDQAKAIYNILRHGFTQACGCPIPHYANLELEARTNKLAPSGRLVLGNAETLLRFNVLCHFDATSLQTPTLPWNWRETVIEPLDEDGAEEYKWLHTRQPSNDDKVTAMAATTVMNNGTSEAVVAAARFLTVLGGSGMNKLTPDPKSVRPKRSKVSFSIPDESDQSTAPSPAPSATSQEPTQNTQTDLEKIDDLCQAIHKRQKEISCLGLLVDERARRHRVSIAKGTLPESSSMKIVSLKMLLSQASRLEKRDRLILGVKLASSVLQLYKTPWWRDIWGKSDIFFVKYNGEDSGTLISKPFVSKAFQSPLCAIQPRTLTDPYSRPSPDVRNQTIFALGVVLIELWFGRPLETLRLPTDLGDHNEANQISDFATARRLSEEVYSEAGDWYGDAVRRCIYCEFDQRHTSLDAEALKEAVYRGVVSPLQENLTSFCGGKLDDILS